MLFRCIHAISVFPSTGNLDGNAVRGGKSGTVVIRFPLPMMINGGVEGHRGENGSKRENRMIGPGHLVASISNGVPRAFFKPEVILVSDFFNVVIEPAKFHGKGNRRNPV